MNLGGGDRRIRSSKSSLVQGEFGASIEYFKILSQKQAKRKIIIVVSFWHRFINKIIQKH